jgi:hypothetical protein
MGNMLLFEYVKNTRPLEQNTMPKQKKVSINQQHWNTIDVLSMACSIYRQKGYTSVSNIVFNGQPNENRWTNKDHLMFQIIPELAESTYISRFDINDIDREQAAAIINHFRKLSFGVLGNNLNDYMTKVFAVTQNDTVMANDLGILASVPQVYDREITDKRVRAQIKDTKQAYLGEVGQSITVNIKYLTAKYLPNLDAYAHDAITDTGYLITFLNKIQMAQPGDCQTIRGRVKKHGVNWHTKTAETQINYVKVVDIIMVWQ